MLGPNQNSMALWLRLYAGVFFGFLYLPIGVLLVLSFNDSPVIGFPLRGFTFDWYHQVFNDSKFFIALFKSFSVGLVSSLIATALGPTCKHSAFDQFLMLLGLGRLHRHYGDIRKLTHRAWLFTCIAVVRLH